jgi:hypothetical protein
MCGESPSYLIWKCCRCKRSCLATVNRSSGMQSLRLESLDEHERSWKTLKDWIWELGPSRKRNDLSVAVSIPNEPLETNNPDIAADRVSSPHLARFIWWKRGFGDSWRKIVPQPNLRPPSSIQTPMAPMDIAPPFIVWKGIWHQSNWYTTDDTKIERGITAVGPITSSVSSLLKLSADAPLYKPPNNYWHE